ncbi:MAG: hypothetical protein ACI4G0_02745 [Ruminococcus sp.]
MIRIKEFETLKDFVLKVVFDDNKTVLYDVKEDMQILPGYEDLAQPGLFPLAQLDQSRTCIYWNDYIDLPSDTIYEYGTVTVGGF